jgi:hypothetical protein
MGGSLTGTLIATPAISGERIMGIGIPIPPSPQPIPEGETECHCSHSIESQHDYDREFGYGMCRVPGCGCMQAEPSTIAHLWIPR